MVNNSMDEQEPQTTIVVMEFEASDPAALAAVLARYVVTARAAEGCRNIDLCVSSLEPLRHVIISKWSSPEHQRVHFDSAEMVSMARDCREVLARAPRIDLLDGISAHDLA